MASLNKMSESRLRALLKEQRQAIETHKKRVYTSSDSTSHATALKRMETRLLEIEKALNEIH